jgi:hypothetical protein
VPKRHYGAQARRHEDFLLKANSADNVSGLKACPALEFNPGLTKRVLFERPNQNYLLPLRLLCARAYRQAGLRLRGLEFPAQCLRAARRHAFVAKIIVTLTGEKVVHRQACKIQLGQHGSPRF